MKSFLVLCVEPSVNRANTCSNGTADSCTRDGTADCAWDGTDAASCRTCDTASNTAHYCPNSSTDTTTCSCASSCSVGSE